MRRTGAWCVGVGQALASRGASPHALGLPRSHGFVALVGGGKFLQILELAVPGRPNPPRRATKRARKAVLSAC